MVMSLIHGLNDEQLPNGVEGSLYDMSRLATVSRFELNGGQHAR